MCFCNCKSSQNPQSTTHVVVRDPRRPHATHPVSSNGEVRTPSQHPLEYPLAPDVHNTPILSQPMVKSEPSSNISLSTSCHSLSHANPPCSTHGSVRTLLPHPIGHLMPLPFPRPPILSQPMVQSEPSYHITLHNSCQALSQFPPT